MGPFGQRSLLNVINQINFKAVLLLGVVSFLFGGIWYSVMFGKQWVELNGFNKKKKEQDPNRIDRPPAIFFMGMITAYLLLVGTMAYVMVLLKIQTGSEGCIFGFLIWIAVAMVGLTHHLNSERPIGIFLINSGFEFFFLVIVGLVLGMWHGQRL